MEQALAATHALLPYSRAPMQLECIGHEGHVMLACTIPTSLERVVPQQIYAHYPDVRLDPIPEEAPPAAGMETWSLDLHLRRDLFPLKRYSQFEDAVNKTAADPLSGLLTLLAAEQAQGLKARLVLTIRAAPRRAIRRRQRCLHRLSSAFFDERHGLAQLYASLATSPRVIARAGSWFLARLAQPNLSAPSLTTSTGQRHEREADLQAAADKLGRLMFRCQLRLTVTAPRQRETEALATLSALAASFGQFHLPRLASFAVRRARRAPAWFLLSAEELATLWHPAMQTVAAPTLRQVDSREREPPVNLPRPRHHEGLAVLGVTSFRDSYRRFGILLDDRRRHVVIEGKTGMGKSTLLRNLLASDIAAGRGAGLIDPHGDLCEAVLACVPSQRTNDVILFDAADAAHPTSFNVLACPDPALRPLLASGVLSCFKKLYGEFWGPRMEHILRNALLAVLEGDAPSLLAVLRMLSDRRYRERAVARLADPMVRSFWETEFASWPAKFQAEAIAPVQNKLGHFVSNPLLRNILGQSRSALDLRRAMDEGKVLLVNLSKGRLGDDASGLLGSFLVTALQLAAMGRAHIPEEERPDFYLYVDEFQNFATESFATILSEARKYRLSLTLANQYLAQMDEATRSAVFGNVGTLVAFQVGAEDADILAEQLAGDLAARDLLTLPRYQAYVRLLIDGHPSRPFSMRTLPPRGGADPRRPAIIRNASRHRYSRPAAQVEEEIRRCVAPA